ncbi:MAG: endolytic transglycosylase MltG [Chitinophagaceae bacterium]
MLKKLLLGFLVIIILAAAFIGWRFFTSNTNFEQKAKYLYIRTGHATYAEVLQTIRDSAFLKNPGSFDVLAGRLDLASKLSPGKYEIKKGTSLFDLVRMLRNGRQVPVNLVITKLRTEEDLASLIGRKFECDSLSVADFLHNNDSLKEYGFDSNSVMTGIYPNTYTYFWNSTPGQVFKKLFAEYHKVWTPERKQQAQQHNLTPAQVYILASIVEEETVVQEDKGNIASVYLNRFHKGMRLQADPTVKFALKNFALRRIYEKHLAVESPYNTYRNAGLPPGPICTPSIATLDAVLQSPATNYLYFVAKSDFSGRHVFSETYEEHLKNAKEFQKALDVQQQIKAARDSLEQNK